MSQLEVPQIYQTLKLFFDEDLHMALIGHLCRVRDQERERCCKAIRDWPGLTDDEKRIAVMAIKGKWDD